MSYQKFGAARLSKMLAVAAMAALPLISAGHSAFSAASQDTVDLAKHFEQLAEPKPLPDMPIQLADHETVILKEDGPKLMLINFWATWCAPCVKELPSLDALEGDMGSDDFEVVAISMDRQGMKVVGPFFEKTNLQNLKPYTDAKGDFGQALGTNALPMTLLVKDGKIIRQIVGPADWASPQAKAIIKAAM